VQSSLSVLSTASAYMISRGGVSSSDAGATTALLGLARIPWCVWQRSLGVL